MDEKLFVENSFNKLKENHEEKFKNTQEEYIPKDMVSEDGGWKLIKSTLTKKEVEKLENKHSIKYPSIYKEFLTTYFHKLNYLEGVIDELNDMDNVKVMVEIISQPSNNPLGVIDSILEDTENLIEWGYIPFGDFNGWGTICFDVVNENKIVWIDHEEYYNCSSREECEEFASPLFEKFQDLLECFFWDIKHTCIE